MNIIAICGSPRKGNTEFLVRRFLAQAEELGHKTELALLREKRIERCGGCLTCDESGSCHIIDDVNLIIGRLAANDLIVFASPNYFNNVTGLMKDFFDRLNPLYGQKTLKGKQAIVVFVGDEMKSIEKALQTVTSVTNALEMDVIGDFFLNARDASDLENDAEGVAKIDEFVKNILS